jgi:hypothetical protein
MFAQATDVWAEKFFGLNAEQRFVLMIIAICCTTGIICTVVGCAAGVSSSMHRRRTEMELKHELLDRGMSADEIAKVVESTPPTDFIERWAASCGKKKTG